MGIDTKAPPKFTVDPREGTVAGPGGNVRLEPKVMEVLAVLTRNRGRVVSRDELLNEVWPGVFVTEQTLSRCIYQLRRDLRRIGGEPDFEEFNVIETLPKRGYRLLADMETMPVHDSQANVATLPVIPFVVGQWVRGNRFYGRAAQISEILEGHQDCIWLLGTRRIGKTSLLKQLELISGTSRNPSYFPIYWDFQGADTPSELHLNFKDALMDVDERLERLGIRLQDVEAEDLFVSLERLRHQLRAKKLKLLLLCDEVEELIQLQRTEPSLPRKLRHALQSREDIRTVLASTIRLWALSQQAEDTSPFLHGFTPPLYIERFSDEEARSLIEQWHLPPEERPNFEVGVADVIREHCDNHPYLIQLVCKRYLESGGLKDAIEQVATDRMVSYFFSVDFEMLSEPEQGIIRVIARQSEVASSGLGEELSLGLDALQGNLRRLENLGYIRRNQEHRFVLANYFFRRWLQNMRDHTDPTVTVATPIPRPRSMDSERTNSKARTARLLAELKKRSVFRVGIAYVVVAWVLLQIGDIAFDFLEVPGWAGKLLIVILVLGLPLALILAWIFELTPEGVKREKDIERGSNR